MTITASQRHQLEVADRTRNIDVISMVVDNMLAEHPQVTPLDIEIALRDAGAQTYLIAGEEISVVLGMPAMLEALSEVEMTPEQNRAELGK